MDALEMTLLFDYYGDLLTERQRMCVDLRHNQDLSLAEIAGEIGISRQGVRELIKKAEEELLFYEEKLGLAKRFRATEEQARALLSMIERQNAASEIRDAARELVRTVKG